MKREIKFRAWNTLMHGESEMIDWERAREFKLRTIEDGVGLQWMQFTGLKDKSGREIYEGDIVKFKTFGGNEMIYDIHWDDTKAAFKPTRFTEKNSLEMKVIGNIYQNPELLK